MIPVTPRIALDESEIEITFVRSSGPGGQNVNKVATAAQLRFDAAGSGSLLISGTKRKQSGEGCDPGFSRPISRKRP